MSTPPVPPDQLRQLKDRIRHALASDTAARMGMPLTNREVCQVAYEISTLYRWAGHRETANALVDILGTGCGAIYLDWAWRNAERTAA